MDYMKCVISGSFRKFYNEIVATAEIFQKQGVEVLSPKISVIRNAGGEFVLLESDATDDIKTLEQAHLDAIKNADFLYLYNPGGYVGVSASLEIGWAIANNKKVFSLEKPADQILGEFVQVKAIEACGN